MGIKNLNRFLRDNCTKKSIQQTHLKQFANKTIVIDTSIYLYKFSSENALMENMYLFISILKSYHITPLFIFDGKPPLEKKDLLIRRSIEKKEAKHKYYELESIISNSDKNITIIGDEEKKEILLEMENLKRKFIRIRDDDIVKVKSLMDAYGVVYFDAPAEADQLCAYLVKTGKAWACISDDMDMFLYGCNYVIRHISLLKHTITLYDTYSILDELNMSEKNFCEIMVLSGTDYNIHSNTSLNETIRWYREYNKYRMKNETINKISFGFYVWLIKNTKYIDDYKTLLQTYQMFQMNCYKDLINWEHIDIPEKNMDTESLKNIMEKEGFIFSKNNNSKTIKQ